MAGKKGSEDAGSKKKGAKAAPFDLATEPGTEPVAEAPVELTEEAPVEPTDEAPAAGAEPAASYDADEPYRYEDPPFAGTYAASETPGPDPIPAPPPEPANPTLDLRDAEERLPWLESDDDFDTPEQGGGRIAGFMLGGLLALAAIVGGIWWVAHRERPQEVADGGVIEAPAVAYKEAPTNPGGKTFDGTGDTSFAVSEGQSRPARLGEQAPKAPVAAPQPAASTASAPKPPAEPQGIGVQVAAFTSRATAEAGWTRLSGQHEALKSVPHRIVEGRADIGTVYRLQAVAPDLAGANALCARLKASGGACQVKR